MGSFHIDDPEIDAEALERRVREAIDAKRGVRFSDAELRELRAARLEPRLRREDLPSGWLAAMPRVRAKLPEIESPPGAEGVLFDTADLYVSGAPGVKGRILRLLRRLMRPFYRTTLNLDWVLNRLAGSTAKAVNDQGSWAGRHLSELTGQLERRRERDLHLFHNLVYELTDTRIQLQQMEDRLDELTRRLDRLAERERAFEELALGTGEDGAAAELRPRRGKVP